MRSRKVYVLKFDDPDMEGLEVRASSVPLGRFLELVKLASILDDDTAVGGAVAEAFTGLFAGFAEALVSWNLDERRDDEIIEVPATLEGMSGQDTDFMLEVIMAWLGIMGDVAAPLGGTSNGGKPSLEASIPMQAPS